MDKSLMIVDEVHRSRLRRTRRSAAFSADLAGKSSAIFAPFRHTVAASCRSAAVVVPGRPPLRANPQ